MPDGVAVGRELVEEARVLTFALPRIGDVGVVRHQHHHVAVVIDDALDGRRRAVRAALRCAAPARPPELDRRDLRQRLHLEHRLEDRVVERNVLDRVLRRRQHARELRQPVLHGVAAPVVVYPEEAALQQERAQPLHFRFGQRRGADVFHVQVGALIEEVLGEAHDEMLRPAVAVLADPGLGEFREADGEIQLGVGVVGRPPLAAGFAAAAGVGRAAEIEAVAEALGLGILHRIAAGTEAAEAAAELRGRGAGQAQHQRDSHEHPFHLASPAERPVVLLHQLPEFLGHFIRAGEDDGVGGFRLAPEAEFEALEPFGDRGLQARQLLDVLVDARVVQLAKRAQDLVEVARIDVLGGEVPAQRLQIARVLPHFTAKLANVFLGQAPVAIVPSTAPAAAPVGAAPRAAVERRCRCCRC